MRGALLGLGLWLGCWGDNAYIVEGTVVETRGPHEVVVAHEPIEGLMDAMTMPFEVRDSRLRQELEPGHRIVARLHIEQEGAYLARVRVTGRGPVPELDEGPGPVRPGQTLPAFEITSSTGQTEILGEGQDVPTAAAFLYTRCPLPEYCPAVVARFQGLQAEMGDEARLLTLTLDPEHDTVEKLAEFAEQVDAKPDTWRFGRLEGEALENLALAAALPVDRQEGEIVHGLRLLVLNDEGELIERYDDNNWPLDRVAEQLRTGGPPAPPGSHGTVTPSDD